MAQRNDADERLTVTSSSDTAIVDEAAPDLPEIGSERYELLGEVARGGVGRIIRARDKRLNRHVAIKRLHEPTKNQTRFIREALLTSRLQHPGIVPVHEVGRFATGEIFFAMKFVEGSSLRDAITRRSTLEERLELLPNVLAVADAIAYSHSEGVIHRDLKPSNVLLGAFGETVVIDWGLAKDLKGDEPTQVATLPVSEVGGIDHTKMGVVLGTPAYMPPEQARGVSADERADVYALGALLYHVICGEPPFGGKDAAEALHRVLHDEPVALAERVPGAPAELCGIVDHAMARSPEGRYRDARAFAEDLRRFQLGQIATLEGNRDGYDAKLDAEFDVEARTRSLRPARTICILALLLNPLFWLSERHILPHRQPSMMAVRATSELLIGMLLVCSWTRFGRRFNRELGLLVLIVLGAMMVVLNQLQEGQLQVGFTGSIMMVFLAYSTFPYMPSRKAVLALSAITALHLAIATASKITTRAVLEQQTTVFLTGIVLAALSVRFSFGVQRAEFYSRRRLELANQRLARLEGTSRRADSTDDFRRPRSP